MRWATAMLGRTGCFGASGRRWWMRATTWSSTTRRPFQALEYAKELHTTFIDGTMSWLDPNNNKAFLSGQIGLTHNGISVYYVAKNSDDPAVRALTDDIYHARPPVGPVGRPTETSLIVNTMVFSHTKYPQACLAYLKHMFELEQYAAWQTACIGYWQHTLQRLRRAAVLDRGSQADPLSRYRSQPCAVRLQGQARRHVGRRACRLRGREHVRARLCGRNYARRMRPRRRKSAPSATTRFDPNTM